VQVTDPQTQDYETTNTVWRGVGLSIRYKPNWCITTGFGHIEIISDARQALPISEIGYKSHFVLPKQLDDYDTATGYVLAWLDHEAATKSWKQREVDARQLDLF
jgi:hypothetical protein